MKNDGIPVYHSKKFGHINANKLASNPHCSNHFPLSIWSWSKSTADNTKLAFVAKGATFPHDLSLPFASNPWIFGGFESPVQLKGVCSIFVALDSSLPLGKRNNAASRAQKKKPLMAENRVSPHHPQQNIDRNDWFVVGVVTPPQLSILYRC